MGLSLPFWPEEEEREGICRKDQSLMQGLALLLLSTSYYMDRKKGEGAEKFTCCAC